MIQDWIKSVFVADGFAIWGFQVWQIVGLAVLIALAWIIGWIISAILLAVFRKTLATWGHAAEVAVLIKRAIRPLGLMLAFILTALFSGGSGGRGEILEPIASARVEALRKEPEHEALDPHPYLAPLSRERCDQGSAGAISKYERSEGFRYVSDQAGRVKTISNPRRRGLRLEQ